MSGIRETAGKSPVTLIMSKALIEVAKVAEFGAKKYSPHNYRKGMKWSFFTDAILRHMIKYCTGQKLDFDPKCEKCINKTCKDHSGLSHLAHIAWNSLAILEFEVEELGENDLFKGYEK